MCNMKNCICSCAESEHWCNGICSVKGCPCADKTRFIIVDGKIIGNKVVEFERPPF